MKNMASIGICTRAKDKYIFLNGNIYFSFIRFKRLSWYMNSIEKTKTHFICTSNKISSYILLRKRPVRLFIIRPIQK